MGDKIKVISLIDENCESFKPRRIYETLIKESDIDEKYAKKVTKRVARKVNNLKKSGVTQITTSQIREMTNVCLLGDGEFEKEEQHGKIGVSVGRFEDLVENGSRDNANQGRGPETLSKILSDEMNKQYALQHVLNKDVARAHLSGDLHVHDLADLAYRSLNCMQHDPRFFIKNGLKVDGNGSHTSTAGSPKHIGALINHMGQMLLSGQQSLSGGQSIPCANVFIAPFCRGLNYQQIKQAIQSFVFSLNMSYATRGLQAPFTSLNLEFSVPDFLQNEVAYGPEGKVAGIYGDYEPETRLIQKAFAEVLIEGDSRGQFHRFPNTIWVLRRNSFGREFEEDLYRVNQLGAKYGTAYFLNLTRTPKNTQKTCMGCRTMTETNWTGDWEKDTIRTGNLAFTSINLPRISYKSTDENEYFENLEDSMKLVEKQLIQRRLRAEKCLNDWKLMSFLTQEDESGPYYRIENSSLSYGFVGMNEALLGLGIEDGIISKEGQNFAMDILEYMNSFAKESQERTGYREGVIGSPAETTAGRFALLDKKYYPKKAIVNGEGNDVYYTNSTHVNVKSDIDLLDKIKIESQFHPEEGAGAIMHCFLKEKPSVESLMKLTKGIAKTETSYWDYTLDFSFCFDCNNLSIGINDICPSCGSNNIEAYSRISGYVQSVGINNGGKSGWNDAKRAELKDRFRYVV